jgi:phage-related protein
MLNIIYHVDSITGLSQVRDDFLGIKKEAVKARISAVIVHVAENNGKTAAVITKNIRGYHFSEIRVKVSKDLYRLLYFIWQDEKIILLHLFVKKEGSKTPNKELLIAEERYNDFINNVKIYG